MYGSLKTVVTASIFKMDHLVYVLLLFGITFCEKLCCGFCEINKIKNISGEILVNDQKIHLNVTNSSISDYDVFGTYYYVDGELAKFTCRKQKNGIYNYHEFIFNVSDVRNETDITGTTEYDLNLYLKLRNKSSRSRYYIDCFMGTLYSKGKFNYRLFLEALTSEIEYPQFQINGLSLRPSSKNDTDYYYVYTYEYYPGEELKVLSNLNPKYYKSISCEGIKLGETSKLNLTILTQPFTAPPASLDCSVKTVQDRFVRIFINITEDLMKFSPYITGIQWSKIIAKFYDNVTDKKGTFYVSYNSNDNTTLHCSHNSSPVKWETNVDEVNSMILPATKTSSKTFQLNENVSESTLECKHHNVTSKVVLIQQREIIKPNSQEYTENSNSNIDSEITSNHPNNKNDDIGKKNLPIIIGVISIIIILLIISLIACICKRKKLPKTDTDINYENLPTHNIGSMPISSQWDTKSFKNENVEDTYAKVIPKSQRTKLTDVYAEPLSKMENTCYATPYQEMIPKSQSKGDAPSEPENFDGYAHIVPKELRNKTEIKVLPTNDGYTENGTKMRNRVDTDKHKYANLNNSDVYANVCSSGC